MTLVNVNPTTLEDSKTFMHVDHENNALCDSYIVEFIHDATENYYERGTYAFTYCNNIKFPLYVLNVLKLCLFCLPMLVDSCSHKLFAHKIPMHRKWVRLKCACHVIHDALVMFQFLSFMRASLQKKYTSVMIRACHSRSRFLSCMYIHDDFMTGSR